MVEGRPMNTPGIFILGVIVTLIVAGAVIALVYAAILDGRDTTVADAEAAGLIAPTAPQR
jgi:hypothetical protein